MNVLFSRTILNEERKNSNSHIHFRDLLSANEPILLKSKSSTSAGASSLMLLPSNDDGVPPKPALPNKNSLSTSRLPSSSYFWSLIENRFVDLVGSHKMISGRSESSHSLRSSTGHKVRSSSFLTLLFDIMNFCSFQYTRIENHQI